MYDIGSFRDMRKKNTKERKHNNSELEVLSAENAPLEAHSPLSTVRSPCSYNMDNRGTYYGSEVESEPDRSNPAWKVSPSVSPEEEKLEEDVKRNEQIQTVWEEIMQEYENERAEFKHLNMERNPFEPEMPVGSKLTAVQYLDHYIFPVLCPALEDTLFRAKKEECLQIQKCVFNGLDYLSEILWNKNPMHPKRIVRGYKNIFDIPFVKIWLYDHPRPIYPLSWIWTKEQAITVLQSYIRRYFVCRDPDCYEMRKFWQTFRQEKRDEECLRQLEHYEEVQEIVGDILNEMVAAGVYKAEWKIHGCFCISQPCHCECKCFKWCKCCRCYKPDKSVAQQFYSYVLPQSSVVTQVSGRSTLRI